MAKFLYILIIIMAIVIELEAQNMNLERNLKDLIENSFNEGIYDSITICFCSHSPVDSRWQSNLKFRKFVRINNSSDIGRIGESFVKEGIFIDLNCQDSYSFLQKASDQKLFTSRIKWLILTNNTEGAMEFLTTLNLAINTDMTIISDKLELYETFKVNYETDLIWSNVGKWPFANGSAGIGFRLARNDYRGYVMNCTFVYNALGLDPSVVIDSLETLAQRDFHPETNQNLRYFDDMALALCQTLNYKCRLIPSPHWGRSDGKGNWSGLVGEVQKGNAEMCTSGLVINGQRLDILEFVDVGFEGRVYFNFLQPSSFGTPTALTVPFSLGLWIVVIFSLPLMVMIFKLFFHYDSSNKLKTWGDSFEFVMGNFTQQGSSDEMTATSSRIKSFFYYILTFFLLVQYNNMVITGLLTPAKRSINSLNQLLESNFILGMMDVPYFYDLSSRGPLGPDTPTKLKWVGKVKSQGNHFYYKIDVALRKLKRGNFAFIGDDTTVNKYLFMSLHGKETCDLTQINTKIPTSRIMISTRKQSPFFENLKMKLLWMGENGIRGHAKTVWDPPKLTCLNQLSAVAVAMKPLLLAYSCLLASLLLGSIIFIIECIVHRFSKNLSRPIALKG